MQRLNAYAAALAAGVLLGFSAIGVAASVDTSGITGAGMGCYLVDCGADTDGPQQPLSQGRIDGIIARYANAYGVPVKLARAVVRVESNFRVDARGRAGEVGLMQIKPDTAKLMGYRGSVADLYDPETNILYAMRYLGKAHQLGGQTVCGTILKYNAGHGAKKMNKVSAAYCDKVQAHLAQ